MKKIVALLIAMVMVLGISTSVFAAPQEQGTLTISNAMKGQTYTAYRVFNAVYTDTSDISEGVVYTVPSSLESKVTSPFSVGTAVASNGEKIVELASNTTDAAVLAWVKANYSEFDSNGTQLDYSDIDGTASAQLDYGYYYVTSSLGSVITIDSLNSAVTIVDKNESQPVGPTKSITAEDSSIETSLDQANVNLSDNKAAVGSVESFKVTFDATNWVESEESDTTAGTGTGTKTKVTVWNFTDTATGLNIDVNTLKITVNGTTIYASGTSVDTVNATTVAGGGENPLTIAIPWVNSTGASLYATQNSGSALIPVVVTYDATVTSAAATVVAPNNVEVKYNDTTKVGNTATTNTYTYKFQIDKIKNEANDYEALTGAKFQLYSAGGTLLKFDQSGTIYTFNASGSVDTIDLTENATAVIQGLDYASYTLKETQAPNGYNKAADTTIEATDLVRVDGTITDENGIDSDSGVVNVINETGTELPSTGGMGTTVLYIIGAILVVGAAVILIARRRTNKED